MEFRRNWVAAVRKTLLAVFALVPISFLTLVAGTLAMRGIDDVLRGRYLYGIYQIVFFCMSLFGTYTLIRYLLGTPLKKCLGGMIAGAIIMLAFVMRPFAYEALEVHFQFENPITNSFLAGIASAVYVVPTLIFWALARSSMLSRRILESSSHGAA